MHARDEPTKRSGISKRTSMERYSDVSDRKRGSGNDSRFEAPPPPRFDAGLVTGRSSYEKKRDDYVSSSSSSKRNLNDYSSSSKRLEYASGSKRSALDDYGSASSKRSYDDTSKRSSGVMSANKRNLDDYSSSSKRDEYNNKSREDYKRELEMRHIPNDRTSSNTYKRGGVEDIRSSRNTKRYEGSSGYGGGSGSNGSVWNSSNHISHTTGAGGSVAVMKPYNEHNGPSDWLLDVGGERNNWGPLPSAQDRYDRNYNERTGGSGPNMYDNPTGRQTQDRYGNGGVTSRY